MMDLNSLSLPSELSSPRSPFTIGEPHTDDAQTFEHLKPVQRAIETMGIRSNGSRQAHSGIT